MDEYKNSMTMHTWKCKKCKTEFKQTWNFIQEGNGCPLCNAFKKTVNNKSKAQQAIENFLKSLKLKIITDSRDYIYPQELDIFIPEKNIAIEYDGLYWHSERQLNFRNNVNPIKYHLMKTEKCLKRQIKLIHVFEDEWISKEKIVKSRLKQILGVNDSKRIHARECKIREIESKESNKFLEKFHIQGKCSSTIKLGAFHDDQLISIMTFSNNKISKKYKNKKSVWELNRFCSNSEYHIPGIVSKLLTHFKNNYKWEKIFLYVDRRWGNGDLYYKLGFNLEHITNPDYWYLKSSTKRIHRIDLNKQLDESNNINKKLLKLKKEKNRIWDCGNLRFSLIKK